MTERGALSKGLTGRDDEDQVLAAVPGDSDSENRLQEDPESMMQTPEE